MHARATRLALIFYAGLLLAGCASHQEPGTEHAPDSQQGLIENALSRNSSAGDAEAEHTEALEARTRELEQSLDGQKSERSLLTFERVPLAVDAPRTRIAVVLDTDTPLQRRMNQAFAGVSRDYPVHLLNDIASRNALSDAGCTVSTASQCAEQLRHLPGIRMLVILSGEDGNRVSVRYHDLELDEISETTALSLPVAGGRVPTQALESLADQVLITSLEQARIAPWLARTLSREQGGWLINAGEASGLKIDDTLRIHRPGRIILGPDGNAAGWVKGRAVGTIRVVTLSGADSAIATLVEGQAPGDNDVLIPIAQ